MIQKSTTEEILEIFFEEPTKKHYLKEISRKIGKAHTSVIKPLDNILKEKLITKKSEKRGKRIFPFFESNIEEEKFKQLKRINNLKKIYFSEIVKEISNELMPKSIVLFGSYSIGEDIESSDIDLFIESKEEKISLKKFEKKLARKINLYFFEDINKLSKEIKENIINGIVLYGAIELK